MQLPQVDAVQAAVAGLAVKLSPVASHWVAAERCRGMILAAPLAADRPSPPLDVSAMDGYAVRLADVRPAVALPVQTTLAAGSPPTPLQPGKAIRIFTGAAVPAEADCVVRREDTRESPDEVLIHLPASGLVHGQNIRRVGENTRQGDVVLPAGELIDSAAIAALASFGTPELLVRRRVRVSILNTGDELAAPGQRVRPWQIRDSNGPTLQAWLDSLPWVQVIHRQRVIDRLNTVRDAIERELEGSDAVCLTGGVSMGDADYVPAAVEQLGGEIAFHRLPIRPGKPVLGASRQGKLILGLPGNPVSVAVTSRVIGRPLLEALAGSASRAASPLVRLENADDKQLDLAWYRLVTVDGDGRVKLIDSRGSGDLVSLARSAGFVEVPPGGSGPGPWRLHLWQ